MPFSQQAENPYQISRLVSYFYPPFFGWRQRAIQVLNDFSRSGRGLFPSCVIVGKVYAGFVGVAVPMLDVKKIPRHSGD